MDWRIPLELERRLEICRPHLPRMRKAAGSLPVSGEIGFYLNTSTSQAGLYPRQSYPFEVKAALDRLHNEYDNHALERQLTVEELRTGDWVKLAYSATARRIGELLNFFPSTSIVPNAPSPLAAMLTSAAVGAGAGYGAGWLGERLLPEKRRGALRRTTALLGGLGGASLAVPWAISNLRTGYGLTSPQPLNAMPGTVPTMDPAPFRIDPVTDVETLPGFEYLGKRSSSWGGSVNDRREPSPFDVNVNALGQTLWQSGASPATAGTTMGAMYAAQLMPDESARPGIVTGHQLGQLALSAGKGYITGKLVGLALNAATGLPTERFGGYGAALGIIGAVVPKLYS